MKKLFAILIYIICCHQQGQAQFYKYSNEFLNIGVGARGLGMSGAMTAITNDVTSAYWNPAGLALMKNKFDLGLMHSEYFAGIAKYDYAAIALPMQDKTMNRTLAFSLIRFGVDDIPNTLFLIEPDGSINYNNITSFSVADYALLISFAQKLKIEGMRIGGNLKIIHRTAGDFATSWGMGIDVGVQYDKNQWHFGAVGKDITTTFNAWSYNFTADEQAVFAQTNNLIPENSIEMTAPQLILGSGYQFMFSKNKISLQPSVDLDFTFDGKRNTLLRTGVFSMDPKIGAEAGYKQVIFLRAGVGNFQQVTNLDSSKVLTVQPNIGVGLKINSVYIDYSLTNLGDLSGSLYSHVFSLRIAINEKSN